MEHGLNVVALLAREFADPGRANCNHRQIGIDGQLLQVLCGEAVPHIGKCGQPQVRLVDAIQPDGFVVVHTGKRRLDVVSSRLERGRQKSLNHFPHPLRLRIRHLQIDLRKLRLAVGAEVFVAEATHDLEIFVEA